MKRVGFLVNPIAGMGGRLGLKGTDGLAEQAQAAGAEPVAPRRADRFLEHFRDLRRLEAALDVQWLTCSGPMGGEALRRAQEPANRIEVLYEDRPPTRASDTRAAVEAFTKAHADLVVFCGGDGTARDVADAAGDAVPILGIPSGVKMHSAVFAVDPAAASEILAAFLRGQLRVGEAEILDLDEEAYRRGEWKVRLYLTAKTLVEPHLVQAGKMMFAEVSEAAVRGELVEHFRELFEEEPDTLFLLGPGSTLESIAHGLSLEKTLLGIDAILGGKTIAKDLTEKGLLALLDRHPRATLVVSPIGAQGFILGRGNLQISPAVLRRIGTRNLTVVATPAKLAATPVLRVDSGDESLDAEIRRKEYLFVLIGYRTTKLHPIQS
ncbi:MAG: ATP-NAD kinase family protein [Candidatus Thermoplasmatota archaeon]